MTEILAPLTRALLAGVFIWLQISMTGILALLTHARQKVMFTRLLTAMMEIRAHSTRALLTGVFMSQ
jgi:hypothetical protein